MGVTTTADEKLDLARYHQRQAAKAISEIYLERPHGTDELELDDRRLLDAMINAATLTSNLGERRYFTNYVTTRHDS